MNAANISVGLPTRPVDGALDASRRGISLLRRHRRLSTCLDVRLQRIDVAIEAGIVPVEASAHCQVLAHHLRQTTEHLLEWLSSGTNVGLPGGFLPPKQK